MIEKHACKAFAALSQETRLRIVRLLVQAGESGMPAGALGAAVGAGSSSLSFHLRRLEEASLVRSSRRARSIVYTARTDEIEGLARFLFEDCCRGSTDPSWRAEPDGLALACPDRVGAEPDDPAAPAF